MAIASLAWGWQQRSHGIALDQWRGRMGPIEGRLSAEEPELQTAAAYLRAARARERNQLPPDYVGAERLLAEGIRRDPLRPEPWLRLSRVLFFQGKTREAEAALLRAETVDPRQPSSRLEGVQLWTLLGQQERAVEAAMWISQVSPALRPDAARALLVTGLPREEVFVLMGGPELPPAEIMPLVNELNPRGAAGLTAIVDMVPEIAFESGTFRSELFSQAVSRRATELAWRLWQQERPDASFIEGPDGQGVMVENTRMQTSPIEGRELPLGWRRPPSGFNVVPSWRPPAQDGPSAGAVTLDIREVSSTQNRNTRWDFYRLLQPAGVPLQIGARVQSDPANRSIIRLRGDVRGTRNSWTSEPSDWGTEGWQILLLDIPAAPSTRLVDLRFDRERRGSPPSGTQTRVMFGGFDVRIPGPEPETEAETSEEES